MAELYSSASGLETSVNDLISIALRQLNLEKMFNIRHANFSRKDDMPSTRDLNEPIPSGKLAGWKLDEKKWNKMLNHYYEIHGWDVKTGYPLKHTLDELNIGYSYYVISNG